MIKNIDELYKDMLQNSEVTPPDSVWDALSSRLSAEVSSPTDNAGNTLSQSVSSSVKGSIKSAGKLATWKTATIVAVAGASVTAAIVATADSGNTDNTEATTITNTATIATTPQSIADSATIAYAPSSAIAASASTATHSHSATPQPTSNSINNGDYNLPKQPIAETTPATTIIDTNIHENTDTMVPVSSAYTATDNMPVVTDTLYIDSLKTTIQQIQSSVNIVVPNLVTPNFDNYNDCWEIIGIEDYYNVHVVIATPKGKIIYESKHYDNSWCPTDIPDGTYFYAINIISHSYHKKGVLEIRSK